MRVEHRDSDKTALVVPPGSSAAIVDSERLNSSTPLSMTGRMYQYTIVSDVKFEDQRARIEGAACFSTNYTERTQCEVSGKRGNCSAVQSWDPLYHRTSLGSCLFTNVDDEAKKYYEAFLILRRLFNTTKPF